MMNDDFVPFADDIVSRMGLQGEDSRAERYQSSILIAASIFELSRAIREMTYKLGIANADTKMGGMEAMAKEMLGISQAIRSLGKDK